LRLNGIPWGDPKEKGFIFLSTIIHACCVVGDLVVDFNGIPWGGPKEKGFIFLFTIIRTCCVVGDLVVDFIVRTCRLQFMASS
jgi:hypothetical protein